MRNAKGVTATGYVRGAVYKNDEAHILFFTGMTYEDLFNLKADMGARWMALFAKSQGCGELGAWLWQQQEIMQVWNNEWRRMDHYLMVPMLHKVIPGERETVYRDAHMAVFLPANPYYQTIEMAMTLSLGRLYKANALPYVKNDSMTQVYDQL